VSEEEKKKREESSPAHGRVSPRPAKKKGGQATRKREGKRDPTAFAACSAGTRDTKKNVYGTKRGGKEGASALHRFNGSRSPGENARKRKQRKEKRTKKGRPPEKRGGKKD